jgi:hypothetical protein
MGSPIFDIVNGFLNRCRGAWIVTGGLRFVPAIDASQINQIDYLAEIILLIIARRQALCRPVVDGVDSQA